MTEQLWACGCCGTVRLMDLLPPFQAQCHTTCCQDGRRPFEPVYAKMAEEEPPPAPPPAGCPTAEELWLTYRKETTDEHLAWGDIEKADSGHGFRAVESLIRSRWPRVVMPSREEIIRCLIDNAHRAADVADAVLDLLRPVAVELDPVELASRIRKSGMTVVNPAGLAAIAIAYFNGKMGQGEAGAPSGSPPVSVVSPHSEPGSDAPPAPSPAERRAALVKKCKEVCGRCADAGPADFSSAYWSATEPTNSGDVCFFPETHVGFNCLPIRREIAKLDAEEAAKAKAPPAPDESLKAEALAMVHLVQRANGVKLTQELQQLLSQGLGWLALAREVRRQKAEELEAIVMEPCDSHTSKLYARIAKLRGETT